MSFYAFYPPSSAGVFNNPANGIPGFPIPSEATLIGGEDPGGDLQAVKVNSSGQLLVEIAAGIANPLPVQDAVAESILTSIDNKQTVIANELANINTDTSNIVITSASIDNKTPGLGQKIMADSSPVVIASNQSSIPVTVASLPLPSGAATETTLSAINTKTPALGQTTMAASSPVVIASNQSAVPVSAASLPLPSGAATEATLSSVDLRLNSLNLKTILVDTGNVTVISSVLPTGAATESTLSAINTKTPSLGQAVMASSSPVVIASNQSAIPASQSGTWNITNISGTVSLPTGAATEASLAKLTLTQGSTTSGQSGTLTLAAVTTAAPSYTNGQTSPLSLDTTGALRVNASVTSTVVTSGSSSVTSVASNASSVSLLASNASRKGATFFNDSTSVLYLKLGATASTSSYTVQIQSNGYYELPTTAVYTGAIDGVWSSANGNARITELS